MPIVTVNSVLLFSIILLITATALYHGVKLPKLENSSQSYLASAQSNFNTSKFNELTNAYLQAWDQLDFQSVFDTYVSGIVIYDVYNDVFQETRLKCLYPRRRYAFVYRTGRVYAHSHNWLKW